MQIKLRNDGKFVRCTVPTDMMPVQEVTVWLDEEQLVSSGTQITYEANFCRITVEFVGARELILSRYYFIEAGVPTVVPMEFVESGWRPKKEGDLKRFTS